MQNNINKCSSHIPGEFHTQHTNPTDPNLRAAPIYAWPECGRALLTGMLAMRAINLLLNILKTEHV